MRPVEEARASIDRIVDRRHAVLLVGDGPTERIVPVTQLPEGAREGMWLRVRFDGDDLVEAAIDEEYTEEVTERIKGKMDQLKSRGRKHP